jgi:hypothetical protein
MHDARWASDPHASALPPGGRERSVTIASGLGATSAHSSLKIPVIEDMDSVAEAAVCAAGMAVSP